MICASCNEEMPNQGAICRRCNPLDDRTPAPENEPLSHHDLATTVRRLKGFVMASFAFGIFVAPFALYMASKALTKYGGSSSADSAVLRQLRQLRTVAAVLLVVWAFLLGGWLASFVGPAA